MKEFIASTQGKLFDISASPPVFRCDEDRIFFEDQKNERKFLIGLLDEEDSRKINENIARRERDKITCEENYYSRPGQSRKPIESEDDEENTEEIHVSKCVRRDVDGDWVRPLFPNGVSISCRRAPFLSQSTPQNGSIKLLLQLIRIC